MTRCAARLIERCRFRGLFDRRLRAGRLTLWHSRHWTRCLRRDQRGHPRHHGRDEASSAGRRRYNGYGDVKNVTHTVEGYEDAGRVRAIFIEDQVAPKRCGHMAGKDVIPTDLMVTKIKAAAAARRSKDFFLIARTDARAIHRSRRRIAPRRAISRSRAAPTASSSRRRNPIEELRRIGRAFQGAPQMANMLEGGQNSRCCQPAELKAMGSAIVAYPDFGDLPRGANHRKGVGRYQGAGQPGASGFDSVDSAPGLQGHHPLRTLGADRGQVRAAARGARHDHPSRLGCLQPLSCGPRHPSRRQRCGSRSAARPALFYLPLNVTDRLGYFSDEGLNVAISDLSAGMAARCRH